MTTYPYNLPEDHPDRLMELEYQQYMDEQQRAYDEALKQAYYGSTMTPIAYLESLGYEVEFEEARLCLYVVTYGTEEWEPMDETELEAFARKRGWVLEDKP